MRILIMSSVQKSRAMVTAVDEHDDLAINQQRNIPDRSFGRAGDERSAALWPGSIRIPWRQAHSMA